MKRTASTLLAAIIAFGSIAAFTSCETTSVRKKRDDKRPMAQKMRSSKAMF